MKVMRAEDLIWRLLRIGGFEGRCCSFFDDIRDERGTLVDIVSRATYNFADTSLNPDILLTDEGNNGFSYPGGVPSDGMWLSESLLENGTTCAVAVTILHEAAHIAGLGSGFADELRAKSSQSRCGLDQPWCNYDPVMDPWWAVDESDISGWGP